MVSMTHALSLARVLLCGLVLGLGGGRAWAFDAEVPKDIRIGPASLTASRQDMLCLALNDYWEARGETLLGRVAVAQVVLNRARDPRFPNTICDVVTENRSGGNRGCQFSWFCDGKSDRPVDQEAWRSSVLMALSILRHDNAVRDPTHGALWYHNTSVRPGWARRMVRTARIGDHMFYNDEGPRFEVPQAAARDSGADPEVAETGSAATDPARLVE